MNMFQLQERIKDFSKDQLVKEMQQPSGAVPPFLVLSELQRRTRMEKAFQAEQAQGQQSTVAQDAIAAAGVPQGGIADMARAMAPQTDMTGNTGAMPVQNMQQGGLIGDPLAPYAQHLDQTYSTPKVENFVENVRNMEQREFGQQSPGMQRAASGPLSFGPPPSQMGALARQAPVPPLTLNAADPYDGMRGFGVMMDNPLQVQQPQYGVSRNISGGQEFVPMQPQTGAMQQMGSPFGIGSIFAARRMADGGVVRMEPGGLLRSTGNAELDAALAELERQRIRQAEVLRSLGLQGDEEGLSGVSADVGSFAPGALGGFGIGGAAPDSLSRVDPNVAAPRTAPGLPSIRPTDAQPILNEQAPPAFRDLAGPATVVGPEQGPQLPATGAPTDFPAQLINRDGERLVLLPDGSAVFPEQLGITSGDLAGAGTADLAGPAAFTDPIYPAFPTQGDLDLRFAEEQRDTAARDAATAADVEADTARRFIAQTFENEANRDTVEKLITPIPEPEAPFDPFEYMRGGTEVGPPTDPFDPAVRAAAIERELADPNLSSARREALESQLAGVRRVYDFAQGAEGAVASTLGVLGEFDAASSNRLGRLIAGVGFPSAGTSLIERGQRQGEIANNLRTGEGFIPGEAGDLDDGSPLAPTTTIVPQTPDAETPRPVPRPDRSTTPPAGGGAGRTGGGTGGGAGARATGAADADKWLALAQFGLGLMASQQPTLGGAIGEAGTAALGQLSAARKEAYERDLAERTLAARSAGASRDRGALTANQALSDIGNQIQSVALRMSMVTSPAERVDLANELELLQQQRQSILAASGFGPASAAAAEAGVDFNAER